MTTISQQAKNNMKKCPKDKFFQEGNHWLESVLQNKPMISIKQ